jgi:hypothetical protein
MGQGNIFSDCAKMDRKQVEKTGDEAAERYRRGWT